MDDDRWRNKASHRIAALNVFSEVEGWGIEEIRNEWLSDMRGFSPEDAKSKEYLKRMDEYIKRAEAILSTIDNDAVLSYQQIAVIEALVYEGSDAYDNIDDAFNYLFPLYEEQLHFADGAVLRAKLTPRSLESAELHHFLKETTANLD
jgi:hypothetical protein